MRQARYNRAVRRYPYDKIDMIEARGRVNPY